jgi:hypothetical protein
MEVDYIEVILYYNFTDWESYRYDYFYINIKMEGLFKIF